MLRNWILIMGFGVVAASCSSNGSRSTGAAGAPGAAGESGAIGEAGSPGESSAAGAPPVAGDAGAGGTSGPDGETGAAGDPGSSGNTGDAPALPDGTLLYVNHATADRDLLVALDLESGEERLITDLTGDGSSGWDIDSYSLSPDRRRIALSSLYGPTKADNATGLATRRLWTLDTDGTDFLRLTPTFPKDSQGRQQFQYDVGDPEWTADGAQVIYDFGTYWWEGTSLEGGSFPWIVEASGKTAPATFPTSSDCSILYPSRNPVSGEFLFVHSVCVPGQGDGDGIYLYPARGSTSPTQLVSSSRADGHVDIYLAKPSWLSDGSGFLFIGGVAETEWRPSIIAYDASTGDLSLILPAPPETAIDGVTISPDSSKIVYCLRATDDGREDLHVIDLSLAEPTDVAITNDGKSCEPAFGF